MLFVFFTSPSVSALISQHFGLNAQQESKNPHYEHKYSKILSYLLWMYRRVSKSYWFNNNSSVSPFEARFSPSIVERKPKQDPEKRFPLFRSRIFFLSIPSFFLVFTSPFSHHLYFSFLPVCLWFGGGVFSLWHDQHD